MRHSIVIALELGAGLCSVNGLCHSTATAVESAGDCYRCERIVSFTAYCVLATLLVMRISDDCLC